MDIVVGVDGSAASASALRWAVEEAALRGVAVRAYHAWHVTYGGEGRPPDDLAAESAARKALHALVDEVGGTVERVLVRGVAASALIDAGRGAAFVVLGSRGGRIGEVAAQVLAHAPCPVVVVPDNS